MSRGIAPLEIAKKHDGDSWWPYSERADVPSPAYSEGPWSLIMDRGACMAIFPADEPLLEGFLPVYKAEREYLEQFLVMYCMRGYEKDDRLVHQDGTVWLFNWRSYTLPQTYVASRVAHAFVHGDVEEGWRIGRAFAEQVDRAVFAEECKAIVK